MYMSMITPEMPYIAVNWQSVFHWRFHKLFKKKKKELGHAPSVCTSDEGRNDSIDGCMVRNIVMLTAIKRWEE